MRRWILVVAIATSSLLAAGCSTSSGGLQDESGSLSPAQQAEGHAYMDGYNYGDSYWPTAKDNGLSYTQECSALSGNAPSGDDANQWEEGCIAAGQALVTDSNP
jgi:hypothetical protein